MKDLYEILGAQARRSMLIRVATLAFLALVLANWRPMGDGILLYAQSIESSKETIDSVTQQRADKEMEIGRYYLSKRNYPGAINRFKVVVTQYPTSSDVEEALARLTEAYLTLGIRSEAQTAVAVLERKFPNGRWTIEASDALRSAGLAPAEDEKSWIAPPF